jgi:hypothetical protein
MNVIFTEISSTVIILNETHPHHAGPVRVGMYLAMRNTSDVAGGKPIAV